MNFGGAEPALPQAEQTPSAEPVSESFSFEGRTIPIRPGDSIGSGLMREGVLVTRRAGRGMPRGLYCGIGVCSECLVTVNGVPNVRACVTPAQPRAHVAIQTAT